MSSSKDTLVFGAIVVLACAAVSVYTYRQTVDSARERAQIVVDNDDCIYLEKSGLSNQHYMVCGGEIVVRSVHPKSMIRPSPDLSSLELKSTAEVLDAKKDK